jgi:hypothetical protein
MHGFIDGFRCLGHGLVDIFNLLVDPVYRNCKKLFHLYYPANDEPARHTEAQKCPYDEQGYEVFGHQNGMSSSENSSFVSGWS